MCTPGQLWMSYDFYGFMIYQIFAVIQASIYIIIISSNFLWLDTFESHGIDGKLFIRIDDTFAEKTLLIANPFQRRRLLNLVENVQKVFNKNRKVILFSMIIGIKISDFHLGANVDG